MAIAVEGKRQFVSYAQNFEDVILWRALRHVQHGCYIDVGAQDPVVDSVSLAFYEHGWRGVHVEPNSSYAERLRAARPDERVVNAAIGASVGTITFFEIPDTGLSTGNAAIADEHRAQGFAVYCTDVSCMPLSDIFAGVTAPDIHWLKIDVEGMEEQVISSWQPSAARPWIVVVESTEPSTTISNFDSWEPFLINLGYEFVYFDGLNRFYVNDRHAELKEHFGPGANIFDNFILSGLATAPFCQGLIDKSNARQHDAELRVEQAEVRRHEAELRAEQTKARQHEAELRVEQAEVRRHEAELRAEQTKARQHEAELRVEQAEVRRHEAELRAASAKANKDISEQQNRILEAQLAKSWARAELAEARFIAIRNSRSWRMTVVLRLPVYLMRRELSIKEIIGRIFHEIIRSLCRAPGIRLMIKHFGHSFPKTSAWLELHYRFYDQVVSERMMPQPHVSCRFVADEISFQRQSTPIEVRGAEPALSQSEASFYRYLLKLTKST